MRRPDDGLASRRRKLMYAKHPELDAPSRPTRCTSDRGNQPQNLDSTTKPNHQTPPMHTIKIHPTPVKLPSLAVLGSTQHAIPSMPGPFHTNRSALASPRNLQSVLSNPPTKRCTSFKSQCQIFDAQSRSRARDRSSWMNTVDLSISHGNRSKPITTTAPYRAVPVSSSFSPERPPTFRSITNLHRLPTPLPPRSRRI